VVSAYIGFMRGAEEVEKLIFSKKRKSSDILRYNLPEPQLSSTFIKSENISTE